MTVTNVTRYSPRKTYWNPQLKGTTTVQPEGNFHLLLEHFGSRKDWTQPLVDCWDFVINSTLGWKEHLGMLAGRFWLATTFQLPGTLKRIQQVCTWKWMVGILISFWDGLCPGAMLVSGRFGCADASVDKSIQTFKIYYFWWFRNPAFTEIRRSPPGMVLKPYNNEINQGTIGCTPQSVSMVFIAFSRDSSGL